MPWTKVYGNKTDFEKALKADPSLRGLTYGKALHESTAQMLETDPSVFVIGEGVDDAGGVFGSTKGLHEQFGTERVMDSPLAENGITGVVIGAAVAGMRPILVHMRVDFIPLTMDQLLNHASKWHYMFGGTVSVPLTVRSIIGRGWGSAAQHSQSLQAMFAHIPGLKVVMPATPFDAKGLLRAAVYDPNPVIFIEHRWLYENMGHVPAEAYEVPLGKAIIRRPGADVTIVALSHMVYDSMKAATELAEAGIDAEVLDLRTIKPLDTGMILESVKKTGRLVIADTGWKEYGIGAEIISTVAEEDPGLLKAPAARVNPPDVPTPASPTLEAAYYPGAEDIIDAVKGLLTKK